MNTNPTKKKALTNHRSATSELATRLDVPRRMTLDQALEWIADDELVEITPQSIRIRKAILNAEERKKAEKKRELAYKERYPDFVVGITPVQYQTAVKEWQLMVEFNIPLQQTSRRAIERESESMLAAS